METITDREFGGVKLKHINRIQVDRDVFCMVIRIKLNDRHLLEQSFWEFNSRVMNEGEYTKLLPFNNLNEFVQCLTLHLEGKQEVRRVSVNYGIYHFGK